MLETGQALGEGSSYHRVDGGEESEKFVQLKKAIKICWKHKFRKFCWKWKKM